MGFSATSMLQANLKLEQAKVKELEAIVAALKERLKALPDDLTEELADLTEDNAQLKAQVEELTAKLRKQDHLLFSLGNENAGRKKKKKRALSKKKKQNFTLKRNVFKEEEIRVLTAELTDWINAVNFSALAEDQLMEELSSGVPLTELVKSIDEETYKKMGKVHAKAGPGSFLAHDNVQAFNKGLAGLGVPLFDLFESNKLVCPAAKRDRRAVLLCLLSLARVAFAKYGVEPPNLIKLEQEIERIRQEAAASQKLADESGQVSVEGTKAGEEEGDEGEDVVALCVLEYCTANGVTNPPQRLRRGEYKFPDGSVGFIRVVRGTPLVHINGGWQQLGECILQMGGEVTDPASNPEDQQHTDAMDVPKGVDKQKSDTEAKVSINVPEEKRERTISASGLEEDEAEAIRYKMTTVEYTAKKEFFFMTAIAVKMKHALREDVAVVPNHDLFHKAMELRIEFYDFSGWISNELVKHYLQEQMESRQSRYTHGNLRQTRMRRVTELAQRQERMNLSNQRTGPV